MAFLILTAMSTGYSHALALRGTKMRFASAAGA